MILRGVLDFSLGNMLCIRGFAKMGDLAKVSKADESYQRDLIKDHEREVLEFLHKKEALFFPEIILSYAIDELPLNTAKFQHKDKSLKIRTKRNTYKNKQDARGTDNIQIATIDIKQHQEALTHNGEALTVNDDLLTTVIYHTILNRIDGNHRLSAADNKQNDQYIQNLITPFCLLLLPKQPNQNHDYSEEQTTTPNKLEKNIFHNINYKHIPLKKEHHYKIIIGDESIFTNEDLEKNFGKEYSLAKQYLDKFNYDNFGSLKQALTDNKYTFTHDLYKIISDKNQSATAENINVKLGLINNIYGNYNPLSNHHHYGLLIAFVYFSIRTNKQLSEKELNAFASWVIENFIYKIAKKDANSIIDMYEMVIEKRYKEIFISMDFSEKYKTTHQAIEGVVSTINQEQEITIKLCPVRLDQFKTGYSYKLDEKIFEQIEKCGLMIADLSSENINVYQEIGFAMGLNRNNTKDNILLLMETDEVKEESTNSQVGFNLQSIKQLRFTNTENLRRLLKEELLIYYGL